MDAERYWELDQGHWKGLEANPTMYFGFIYMIEHKASGKLYIGKKQYWSAVDKAGCKSRVTDRQSVKWKQQCWKESDWRYYRGSSKKLNEFMRKNPSDEYEYTILKECRSKGSLHFDELWELWSRDVLRTRDDKGGYKYWNISIGAIKFRPPEYVSDATRERLSIASLGKNTNSEVVTLINLKTKQEVSGTRSELPALTGLKYQSLVSLCNKDIKSLSNWRLIERKDEPARRKRGPYGDEHRKAISTGLLTKNIKASAKTRERLSAVHRGTGNANASISEETARSVLEALRDGESVKAVREKFGLTANVVQKIKHARTWKHLHEESKWEDQGLRMDPSMSIDPE